MQRLFKIVCRGSKLSLAQAAIFKNKLLTAEPGVLVEIVIKETRGDANQLVPLQDIEGKDFFTGDIQDSLLKGEADFAVHSLKDVSGENFFEGTHYAIIEREDPRDVAILSKQALQKIAKGETLILGTSSPRRMDMAAAFLREALPSLNNRKPMVRTFSIRGNVDTRLQKLSAGDFDGVVLACAGLNRLLRSEAKEEVAALLADKLIMILPLLKCPPAPGQGAIVAEAVPGNRQAVQLLHAVNNAALAEQVTLERRVAHLYGSGCHQKFGAIYMDVGDEPAVYAYGVDRSDNAFKAYYSGDGRKTERRRIYTVVYEDEPVFSENNIRIVTRQNINSFTNDAPGKIWVEDTSLWYDLASRGEWVEGSLEGLGTFFNSYTMSSPLARITAHSIKEKRS